MALKPDRDDPQKSQTALAAELAVALQMLFSVATDKRTQLPKGELYTDMALNGARVALDKAEAAGLLKEPEQQIRRCAP